MTHPIISMINAHVKCLKCGVQGVGNCKCWDKKKPKVPKLPRPLEKDVQSAIMDYLTMAHIFAWVNKTQGTFNAQRGCFIKTKMKKGVSDILGVLPGGRFLAIEVKRPGEKMTPEQVQFVSDVNNRGGVAFTADNVKTVAEVLINKKVI